MTYWMIYQIFHSQNEHNLEIKDLTLNQVREVGKISEMIEM